MSAKNYVLLSVMCLVIGCATGGREGEQAGDAVLLVVPARPTIVQYGFDIATLRPAVLVSYQHAARSSTPILHVWDKASQEWTRISIEEYSSGASFPKTPKRAIVIGDNVALVSKLVEAAASIGNVRSIPTLNLMDLSNSLNEDLKFSAGEWKWLAKMHGLQLKDLNADRRRYGKYGKPGEKRTPPMPQSGADIVEKKLAPVPVAPEVKAEPKAEVKAELKAPAAEPAPKAPAAKAPPPTPPAPKTLRDLPPEDK